MSITGRFEADFQSFYAAVEKAEAKLADFQSGAGRVETSLNRMVDSFSGRKLLQEATVAAEAIERIGGVSMLTGDELQKAAVKASAAVEKMKAMGVEVPPGIARVAAELKPVHEEVGYIGESVKDLAGKFVGAFAVEKVIEFALNVGKAQQQLSRLSAETQIGTDDLQDLTAATADYGLQNTELAKALFSVSKGIAGGDESVVRGLHQAGITLDELKDKHGKELFLDIERGLATLQGSLRDTAAADIFGAKLGAAMAGFAKEADAAVAKAEQFNSKLSKEEVENLKRYADEVERLERNLGTLKDKILGGVAGAINSVTEANKNGVSWLKLATASVKDYFSQLTGQGPGVNLFTEIAISEAKVAEEQERVTAGAKEQTEELSKEAQAIQFLTSLRLDAGKALEGYQRRGLDELREMGQLNQANAAAIGVSVDQFKKYTEEVRAAEVQTKALTDATAAQNAQLEKIRATVSETNTKRHGTQTEVELADLKGKEEAEIASNNRRAEALKASLIAQHADTKENLAQIDADTKTANDKISGYFKQLSQGVGVDWDEIKSHSQAALDDAADRAKKTYIEALSTTGLTREELDKLEQKWRDAAAAATASGRAAVAGGKQATAAVLDTNKALVAQFEEQQRLLAIERQRGGGFDVTAANFDKFTAPQGLSKGSILSLLKQGFSVQNAVDILYAQARGVGLDLSKWPEEARGPRVPGFKYGVQDFGGGNAIVGEDGPEVVNLPRGASVLPLKGGGRAGGDTHIYSKVYVSGVFDPSSAHALKSTVEDAGFRSLLQGRKLPA